MRQCIVDVEELLTELNKELAPTVKASVVTNLYRLQFAEKRKGNSGVGVAQIIQLVRAS